MISREPSVKLGVLSPNAIWFQTHGTQKAAVSRIGCNGGERYKVEIYETAHGMRKLLIESVEDTLVIAKKAVLKFFGV